MQPTILKKCIDELSKDSPKLDYIRGMLETLYEMLEVSVKPIVSTTSAVSPHNPITHTTTIPLQQYHDVPSVTQERLKEVQHLNSEIG